MGSSPRGTIDQLPLIVVVCGMNREARLLQAENILTVVGGGVRSLLEERLRSQANTSTAGVISIGIAGALSPEIDVGDCVVASEVISDSARHLTEKAWVQRLSGALCDVHVGPIAGADLMLTEPNQKRSLYDATRALAVDMESHIAAAFAAERGVPFAALRVVSDDARHALPSAVLNAMKPDGGIDVPAVIGSLFRNPFQIPALIRTARDSETALKALLGCLDRLGPGLMGPDLG